MKAFIDYILYQSSFLSMYVLVTGYFLILYFGVGQCFRSVCGALLSRGVLTEICKDVVDNKQIAMEVKNSIRSILIFGFSGIPVIYGIRVGFITLAPDTFTNVVIGLFVLNIWNEVHFFIVHRMLHLPFFMKRVHYIHHQSVVPTTHSVYSFHWFEAVLLSTVPISIVPFFSFSPTAIALYPLTSMFFNLCGHCNYRFAQGEENSWWTISRNHHQHHFSYSKTYGFVTTILDKLLIKNSKK